MKVVRSKEDVGFFFGSLFFLNETLDFDFHSDSSLMATNSCFSSSCVKCSYDTIIHQVSTSFAVTSSFLYATFLTSSPQHLPPHYSSSSSSSPSPTGGGGSGILKLSKLAHWLLL